MEIFKDIPEFQNVSPIVQWAILIVGCLIILFAVVALIVSLWLSIKYIRFNRRCRNKKRIWFYFKNNHKRKENLISYKK